MYVYPFSLYCSSINGEKKQPTPFCLSLKLFWSTLSLCIPLFRPLGLSQLKLLQGLTPPLGKCVTGFFEVNHFTPYYGKHFTLENVLHIFAQPNKRKRVKYFTGKYFTFKQTEPQSKLQKINRKCFVMQCQFCRILFSPKNNILGRVRERSLILFYNAQACKKNVSYLQEKKKKAKTIFFFSRSAGKNTCTKPSSLVTHQIQMSRVTDTKKTLKQNLRK